MHSVAKNLSNQSTRTQAGAIIERWLATGDFPNRMLEDVREHVLQRILVGAHDKGLRDRIIGPRGEQQADADD